MLTAAAVTFYRCGPLPLDPRYNPDYASVAISGVDGKPVAEPVTVSQRAPVVLSIRVNLPEYMDSLLVTITPGNGASPDTSYRLPLPGKNDTLVRSTISFPDPGTRTCMVIAYVNNGKQTEDTVVFQVDPQILHAPSRFKARELDFFSEKNSGRKYVLDEYITGSEVDSVTYQLLCNESVMAIDGSLVTVSAAADTGIYTCKVAVSDGSDKDTATIIWTVIAGNDTDTVIPVEPEPVDSLPLKWTSAETLMVIDEATQKTVSYAAVSAQGKMVTYKPGSAPAFVNLSVSGAGVIFAISPDYEVVSSPHDSLDSMVTISAWSDTDTITQRITVRVRNVNRAPRFTVFPADTVHANPGTLLSTEPLAGVDPDNEAVMFLLPVPIEGMSISSRKITWNVPASGVSAGQKIVVKVRISDGRAFSDDSFIVLID